MLLLLPLPLLLPLLPPPTVSAAAVAGTTPAGAGRALVPLEGAFAVTRSNETNLGDYVCDSFLRAVPSSVTAKTGKINICLMVAGGIRLGVNVSIRLLSVGFVATS